LAVHLIGERGIAQPPAPAVARPDMDPDLSGNAPRRAGETQEKRRQDPGRERPFALVEQGVGEVIEGALAAIAPVAFTSRSVVIIPPWIDVLTLAPGTLEGPIFPSQGMDVGLTLCDVEELMEVREHRHG